MQNQLFTGDNLNIMYGMDSASVDLIYLDPPFNTKRTYSAPIGSKAAGAAFKDMWSWSDVDEVCLHGLVGYDGLIEYIESVGNIHGRAMMAYLTYMAQRIIEMHRILKPTGSLYLHCDPTASHYLKGLMDTIFGEHNFLNEIIWWYDTGGMSKTRYSRKHDVILFYANGKNWNFNIDMVMTEKNPTQQKRYELGKKYGDKSTYRLSSTKKYPHDVFQMHAINPKAKERTGYPTQKPLALLERLIKASSNAGDVVFDPFCGCATAPVAAQQLNRHWIGIDIEAQAADLLVERLSDDAGLFSDFVHLTAPPTRTDIIQIEPTQSVKTQLFAAQNGKCNGCENTYQDKDMEIDHITPKSRGGGDFIENYQLLCGNCNRIKGNRPMEFLLMRIEKRKAHLRNRITFGDM